MIAVLTGGLHLDGLADTADGLGSRRPAAAALDIMRRPDIGPMGVGALVFVLLIQASALAAVPRPPLAAAALVLAEVTGRVSVVIATAAPAARPGGFGALVAGRTTGAERALTAGALACAVAAAALTFSGPQLTVRGLAATVAGLLAGRLLQRTARRRLGGLTGDVFGAILQVSATAVLVTAALAGAAGLRRAVAVPDGSDPRPTPGQSDGGADGVKTSSTRSSAIRAAASSSSGGTARPCFSLMARNRERLAATSSRISAVAVTWT